MVQVDNKTKEIKITVPGGIGELVNMQTALMDLMQSFNFNDYGSSAQGTFYWAINLLQIITLDEDQQQRGTTEPSPEDKR